MRAILLAISAAAVSLLWALIRRGNRVLKNFLSLTPFPETLQVQADGTTSKCYPNRPAEIFDSPTVNLSVVVPAYCEEQRLPPTLDVMFTYLDRRSLTSTERFDYELIVVDDGSTDNTIKTCLPFLRDHGSTFRVLKFARNMGKGAAVRAGVMRSRGSLILFADADNATSFEEIEKLEKVAEEAKCYTDSFVICGSRSHLEMQSIVTRSYARSMLMKGFHVCVRLFGVSNVRDTQCGFKMFSRCAALQLFTELRVNRWAFDVELLTIAFAKRIPTFEVAVEWTEKAGSKLIPVFSWASMAFDIWRIWLRHRLLRVPVIQRMFK